MNELAKAYNANLDPQTLTTNEQIIEFFLTVSNTSEKTKETYKRNIKPFLKFIEEQNQTLITATNLTIIYYRKMLKDQGKKPSTVNAYLAVIKAVYKVMASFKMCDNITESIKSEKVSKSGTKSALTLEQTQRLLQDPAEGATEQELRDTAILNLCALKGLRTIEIARANIEDIHEEQGETYLKVQGKGHNDKDTEVKLQYDVLAPLIRYLEKRKCTAPKAPLFASVAHRNAGGRMTTNSISRLVKNALRANGLNSNRLTAHSLRHTAVTLALKEGAKIDEVRKLARHTNINTTLIYAHNLDELEDPAGDILVNAVKGNKSA